MITSTSSSTSSARIVSPRSCTSSQVNALRRSGRLSVTTATRSATSTSKMPESVTRASFFHSTSSVHASKCQFGGKWPLKCHLLGWRTGEPGRHLSPPRVARDRSGSRRRRRRGGRSTAARSACRSRACPCRRYSARSRRRVAVDCAGSVSGAAAHARLRPLHRVVREVAGDERVLARPTRCARRRGRACGRAWARAGSRR